ncbi:hypothetical protein HHK36_005551 [Tetracentron sinense]|uniref:Gnk2-homologous domain-containing protein n=1 Tax=Tetracentron sinense TaxID=13715 RepID=A0A834ZL92_TETSI|nr:hypothetical protein HHK36_005551 [Tetracentron sinense]
MMKFHVSDSIHLLFLTYLAVLFHIPSISVNAFQRCYDSQNYTSGGQFETNLKHLFNSLYTKGPPTRFNTTISGEAPDRVYGLVQCDPTSSEEDCRSCVNASSIEIVRLCPNRKQAVLRNNNCHLRYSDSSFFSQVDVSVREYAWPVSNVSDPLVFNQQLRALMDNLSSTAASSPIKYATGITNLTDFEKIYGLLQCTRDLSTTGCSSCLGQIISDIPTCCNGMTGGNVVTASCNLRYEIYPFFVNLAPPPQSPLEASPPPPQIEGDQNTNKTEKDSIHLLFLTYLVVLFHFPSISVNAFQVCYDSQNYTSGGQFETNLKRLFNSLYTKGPPTRFNTTISGEAPDRVYGLVQCDPTSSEEDCRSCVNASSIEIVRLCPNRKQAVLRKDKCYLRYSDSTFFSQVDSTPRLYAWPVRNVSDPVRFNRQLGILMDNLSTTAESSQIKYATGITNFTYFDKIYGLLQCTRDLLGKDCYSCLREIIRNIPTCCNGKAGGNVLSVSCSLRYEIYPFFEDIPPPSPTPLEASPPPPQIEGDQNTNTTKKTQGDGNKNTSKIIVSVAVPVVVGIALVSVVFTCLLWRKAVRKKDDAIHLLFFTYLVLFQIPSIRVNAYHHDCYDLQSQNYTSGDKFETNLKRLFNSFYTKGPPTRFNTTISGDTPDRVYGLVQCDPTSSEEECRNCVNGSTIEIVRLCHNTKQAVLLYNICYLRYSDLPFFSQLDPLTRFYYAWPNRDASDPVLFKQKLGALMDNLSSTTPSNLIKYATGTTKFTDFEKIYGLLQCTRDLSATDCRSCLQQIISHIPKCCDGRAGGNVLTVRCNLRYETYPFFKYIPPPPPSPLEASPPPPQIEGDQDTNTTIKTEGDGNRNNSKIIVSVAVPVVAGIVLVSVVFTCLLWRNAVKKDDEAICLLLIISLQLIWGDGRSDNPVLLTACANSERYASGSKFENNLDTLLVSLVSNGSSTGFSKISIGESPDLVNGLVQCKDEISVSECRNCLNRTRAEIARRCPFKKEVDIRFEYCLLRFSDKQLSFQQNGTPWIGYSDDGNVSNTIDFNGKLIDFMNTLSSQAELDPNKFEEAVTILNENSSISGWVQCTRDQSGANCLWCLQGAIGELESCCNGSRGWVASPSCILSYKVKPLIQSSERSPAPITDSPIPLAPSPAPSPPPQLDRDSDSAPNTTNTSRKEGKGIIKVLEVLALMASTINWSGRKGNVITNHVNH